MSSPLLLAREVAALLDSDPILARQIKEHLSEDRLIDLLEIEPKVEVEIEAVEHSEMLNHIVENFILSDVIAAYRKAGTAA